MNDATVVMGALILNLAAQSTIVFALALLAARVLARQPARRHAILGLAFIAALVAPLASEIVRRGGWGLLQPHPTVADTATPTASEPPETLPFVLPQEERLPRELRDDAQDVNAEALATAAAPDATPEPYTDTTLSPARAIPTVAEPDAASASWLALGSALAWAAVLVWAAASLLAGWRLLRGFVAGRRLLARATPCREPALVAAVRAAVGQLGLRNAEPEVYQSSEVRCPVIWCWGRRPRLLLPESAVRAWSHEQWIPILCHELAHWKRRDYLAALTAEVVCCLMPWQALAWWSKRRLEHASEEACDDWALAVGHSAPDYAETLLGLVAERNAPLALAALRRSSGLAARLRHILSSAVPNPRPGRTWGILVLCAASAAIGAAALCQRGVATAAAAPAAASDDAPDAKADPTAAQTSPDEAASATKPYKAFGTITDTSGQPVAGADVFWEVTAKGEPKDGVWPTPQVRAQTATDDQGRFEIETEIDQDNISYAGLVIRAAGFGVRARPTPLEKLSEPIEIELEPTYTITGTVFSPNGEPIRGAKVYMTSLRRAAQDKTETYENWWGLTLSARESEEMKPRAYWPEAVETDAQGQFRFEGVVPKSANASLIVRADEFAPTRLDVASPDSIKADIRNYRDATFTLVLETPYVVHGQFLDERSGEPIPGVRMTVMPRYNGMGYPVDNQEVHADEQGRYTVRLASADTYWTQVFPPLGYGGLNETVSSSELDKMAKPDRSVKFDVKLRRGLVLRGRVVDEETGEPVPGANVVYRKPLKRSVGINNDFRPAETDAEGNFAVTGFDGQGFLLVDAPGKGFYRQVLDDRRLTNRELLHPHGYVEIDVPKEGQSEPLTIGLKRGIPLVARVLSPDGQPVKTLQSGYEGQDLDRLFSGMPCRDGTFRIEAAEPGRTYRVLLFSEDAMAGKVAELVAPSDGKPFDVRLEPCATIKGRYVYDSGVGVPEISNFSHFSMEPAVPDDGDEFRIFDLPFYSNITRHQGKKRVTDDEGNFELDGIVPGALMYLSVNYQFPDGNGWRKVGRLAPGEVKDLGELVIRPRQ